VKERGKRRILYGIEIKISMKETGTGAREEYGG
jgi:hypothetical protein